MSASREFNWAAFHARRKILKLVGLLLVLGGLFVMLNFMGEVPEEPLKGKSAIFAGMVLLIFGFLALYKGYRLPLEEALELLHRKGRGITESELVHDMRVDQATAQRIIAEMIRKGFLRRAAEQAGAMDEVFEPVK